MDFAGFGLGGFTIFAVLAFLFNIFITILWIVIGWRAMRAHEKLADYIEVMIRRQVNQSETQSHVSTDD